MPTECIFLDRQLCVLLGPLPPRSVSLTVWFQQRAASGDTSRTCGLSAGALLLLPLAILCRDRKLPGRVGLLLLCYCFIFILCRKERLAAAEQT